MILKQEQLEKLLPDNKHLPEWFAALTELLPKYEINTVNRIAGFIAQCSHESAKFTVIKENLNYGAAGLRSTFRKYFPTDALAAQYQRQPEKIANLVYANRMGNGPESSGDGFRYCGRGLIQLTGHDNYAKFAESIDKTLEETSAYMSTFAGAAESACWFWHERKLNVDCDNDDIKTMTTKINGGTNGIEERTQNYSRAKQLLGA